MNTNTTLVPTIITVTIHSTTDIAPWLAMIIKRDSFSLHQSPLQGGVGGYATVEGEATTHTGRQIKLSLVREDDNSWGWKGVMTLTVPPPYAWADEETLAMPNGRGCLKQLLQEVACHRGGVTAQTCDPREGVAVTIGDTPAIWGQYTGAAKGEWYITN